MVSRVPCVGSVDGLDDVGEAVAIVVGVGVGVGVGLRRAPRFRARPRTQTLSFFAGTRHRLLYEKTGRPRNRKKVAGMQRSVERATSLVTAMLDFAIETPFTPELVDLPRLIQDTRDLLENDLAANRVRVDFAIESRLPPVRLDRPRMEQVLVNLMRNAIQATNLSGDPPVVRIEAARLGTRRVCIAQSSSSLPGCRPTGTPTGKILPWQCPELDQQPPENEDLRAQPVFELSEVA